METSRPIHHGHYCRECGVRFDCFEECELRRRTFWAWLRAELPMAEEEGGLCLECARGMFDRLEEDVLRALGDMESA